MTATTTDKFSREEILNKVDALLARTTSPFPAEAATAAKLAVELLDKYQLTMADVHNWADTPDARVGIVEETFVYSGRTSPLKRWKEDLAGVLSYQMQVKLLTKAKTTFVFIGEATNVAVVMSLYQWLVSQLEVAAVPAWKEYARKCNDEGTHREDPLVFRSSFFQGAISTIDDRLRQRAATSTAIVRVHRESIDDFMKASYPILKTAKKRKASKADYSAYVQGKIVGESVNLGDAGVLP